MANIECGPVVFGSIIYLSLDVCPTLDWTRTRPFSSTHKTLTTLVVVCYDAMQVRRVAALEGEEMVTPSGRDEEDAYTIPPVSSRMC